jgi:3-oxoacyl-[acyl-carrier protein] reductase
MNLDLHGKRALVSGAEAGIGRAIAELLAQEGAEVVVQGSHDDLVGDVVDAIGARGFTGHRAIGDLTDIAGIEAVIEQGLSALGHIDILVNNAGLYANTTWDDVSAERWLTIYNANVVSAVRLIQAFVPGMRGRGFGRVIQIGSVEATHPLAGMPEYAASKGALSNVTVSLAKALSGTGVTVNTVSPGIILTPRVEALFREVAVARAWGSSWADIERGIIRDVLPNCAGRLGTPEEVAFVVALLASPRSAYVTGSTYRVDGGSFAMVC